MFTDSKVEFGARRGFIGQIAMLFSRPNSVILSEAAHPGWAAQSKDPDRPRTGWIARTLLPAPHAQPEWKAGTRRFSTTVCVW